MASSMSIGDGGGDEIKDGLLTTPTTAPKSEIKTTEQELNQITNLILDQQKTQAEYEKKLGNDAYKIKDFDAALKHYDMALKLDSTNMIYLTNKAAVYFEINQIEECIKACENAIEVGRDNNADLSFIAKAYARIGNAYKKANDLESALVYYDYSLRKHHNSEIDKIKKEVEKKIEEQDSLSTTSMLKSLENINITTENDYLLCSQPVEK